MEGVLDCPYCGIIYDRFDPDRPRRAATRSAPLPRDPVGEAAAGAAESAAAKPKLDDLYQGPDPDEMVLDDPLSAGLEPTGGGGLPGPAAMPSAKAEGPPPSGLGKLVTDAPLPALLVLFALYLVVQVFWNANILGGTSSPASVENRFFALTGVEPPDDYHDAGQIRFVGRDFLWFVKETEELPTIVFVYHCGSFAPEQSSEELVATFDGWLEDLEVPRQRLSRRPTEIGNRPAELQVYGVGPEDRSVAQLALLTFSTPDDRPALLALAGSGREFHALRRKFYR